MKWGERETFDYTDDVWISPKFSENGGDHGNEKFEEVGEFPDVVDYRHFLVGFSSRSPNGAING